MCYLCDEKVYKFLFFYDRDVYVNGYFYVIFLIVGVDGIGYR